MNFQKTKFLLLAAVIMMAASCSETKKLNKAKQRVLTNKEAFNEVGATWARLNPCSIDSVIKYATSEVIKIDTFYSHGDVVYAPKDHDTVTIYKQKNRTDTIKIYLRDLRYENTLKDTITAYKVSNSGYQAAYEIKNTESAKRLKFVFLLLFIIIAENVGILIYKAKTL